MIIQGILTFGLLLCLAYAFQQRQKSRYVSLAISGVAVAGICFVLAPGVPDRIAHLVGVGRGADLVMYCWLVISLIVSVNLQFKILGLQRLITELAREMTLRAPRGESKGNTDCVRELPPTINHAR